MTNISNIAKVVHAINNPNLPLTTLIEEVPSDIGRTYAGYKRGGKIEATEKLTRELLGAIVWVAGIPAFKWIIENICEKGLSIPMNIDYSNSKEGNDAIKESVEFITSGAKTVTDKTQELKKYLIPKFQNQDPGQMIKNITSAKKFAVISAFILNCIAMGVVLPKITQAITRKRLKKMEKSTIKPLTMDEYKQKTKNNSSLSFTGLIDTFVYKLESDNVIRLFSTDIPMLTGRVVTSRNKYEALENGILDGGSSYFYNFAFLNVQMLLRKFFKTPKVSPKVTELIIQDENALKSALKNLSDNEIMNEINNMKGKDTSRNVLFKLFGEDNKDLVNNIYNNATYGKYNKINKFIRNKDIDEINNSVITFLKKMINPKNSTIDNNGDLIMENVKKFTKSLNYKTGAFLFAGLATSVFGLAILMPKLSFWVTKKLTGKNQFTGIAKYDDDKK